MPSHIKTCDGSEDPEDHLKIFQAAAKIERWAMPTWCHMFNSTLTENARVWFDDLLAELIDSYDDLKKAFLENYLQQKKYIKDPIELHNIKQQDGESTKDFVRRYKLESSGPPSFLRGEVADSNTAVESRSQCGSNNEGNQMQISGKESFWNQQGGKEARAGLRSYKNSKEIFPLKKGKFKAPPPMTTPVKKRNHAKFCEFHGEVGGKKQPKAAKKGETSGKDKALTILMVQPWERVVRQTITQSFSLNPEILFPPLGEDEGTEGPMIIEAEIGGHCRHRMYVDGGSASEILYEHCFSRLRSEIKKQLVPATIPLIGFSGEIIWPIGQIQLLAMSQKVTSSSVDSSRNAEAPEGKPPAASISGRRSDMTGVPRHIAEHRLNVREGCSPVRQKKRGQATDRNQAIQKEVGKLVEARIMKEVHYHDWLSNPVMVKKHDNSWRMCVDFKDLNKACLKDGHPLPEID
ncbi:reverse transcriptase domain-containing protein [Tanacetum coccineum]